MRGSPTAKLRIWRTGSTARHRFTGETGGLLRKTGLPENFIVVNPQFGSLQLHGNDDNSIYHSLQTTLSKRMSKGFSGEFSYTWSRNLGNSAAGNANASDTTATKRDPRNRSCSAVWSRSTARTA